FDGEKFHNQVPGEPTFSEMARWGRGRVPGKWPAFVDASPAPAPPQRVGKGELRITFVNHATVLVQIDGVNLLTDPIWGEVAGPDTSCARVRGASTSRATPGTGRTSRRSRTASARPRWPCSRSRRGCRASCSRRCTWTRATP